MFKECLIAQIAIHQFSLLFRGFRQFKCFNNLNFIFIKITVKRGNLAKFSKRWEFNKCFNRKFVIAFQMQKSVHIKFYKKFTRIIVYFGTCIHFQFTAHVQSVFL